MFHENLPSYELGLEPGLEWGQEKGVELERRRFAKSLPDLLPDTVIAEKTDLPLEEIERLSPAMA